MHILERYAMLLESDPASISELFAHDGYFYDGGMKVIGREKCYLAGRAEIHANFARTENKVNATVSNIRVNGQAMRYDVTAMGRVFKALAVAVINNDLIQSMAIEVIEDEVAPR